MSDGPSYGFDTLQIHAGARPDPATGARQTPIYQTTAYVFRDAEHAAALFNLQEVGYIYSRLTNPTVAVLQERIATLEGGVGAVCCSSGHAAQIMALFPLMQPGMNIVASTRLYGGTVTQFSQTIKRFGWSAKFVDFDDLDAVKAMPSTTTPARSSAKHRQSRRLHHRYPRHRRRGRCRRCAADRRQHVGHAVPVPPDRARAPRWWCIPPPNT
jgi:O-acetylhomoserine (thiol)-lyase